MSTIGDGKWPVLLARWTEPWCGRCISVAPWLICRTYCEARMAYEFACDRAQASWRAAQSRVAIVGATEASGGDCDG
jgi:hypothetical protein